MLIKLTDSSQTLSSKVDQIEEHSELVKAKSGEITNRNY